MNGQQFRQGDVWIERVDGLPEAAHRVEGPVVLARGEVTGHAHRVEHPGAELWESADKRRFLALVEAAPVLHEEHGAIELEPGVYEVRRQREFVPMGVRFVKD